MGGGGEQPQGANVFLNYIGRGICEQHGNADPRRVRQDHRPVLPRRTQGTCAQENKNGRCWLCLQEACTCPHLHSERQRDTEAETEREAAHNRQPQE